LGQSIERIRRERAPVTRTIFDHVAIATRTLADGWQLFGGFLGGTWVYGGDSPGYWWGQLRFGAGPPPAGLPEPGPASAFEPVEHHVTDVSGATRLFTELLNAELITLAGSQDRPVADLTWSNGARLRLARQHPHVPSLHPHERRVQRGRTDPRSGVG
jgi:hypothetical protein